MRNKNKACADAQTATAFDRLGTKGGALVGSLSLAVVLLCVIMIWPLQAAAFNQEGGLIETISATALLAAGLVALVRFPGLSRLYIALVCLLLAERELEAEVYTEGSVLFVVLEWLDLLLDAATVRIALGVIVIGGLLRHGIPNGVRALKIRAPFLMVFALAGSVAVLAQILEEVSGFFSESLSVTMATRLFVLEETLEMYFSIGILAAVLIGWPKIRSEEIQNDKRSERLPDAR